MPYIKQEDREKYDKHLQAIRDKFGDLNPDYDIGHLTYCIYYLMKAWMWHLPVSYQRMSAVIATAIDAATEFRRCELTPYEEEKIKDNGYVDVSKD